MWLFFLQDFVIMQFGSLDVNREQNGCQMLKELIGFIFPADVF